MRPRLAWTEMSERKRWRWRQKTTCASIALSKYRSTMVAVALSTWPRKESPTSICLPVTVTCMGSTTWEKPLCKTRRPSKNRASYDLRPWEPSRGGTIARGDVTVSQGERTLAPALHRGGDAHSLAVFGDCAPRNVDALFEQDLDDAIIGKHVVRLGLDERLDAEAHRLGRKRFAAARRRDRRGEEIFELIDAARRRHVFVRRHAAHRAFMHADRLGDVAQDERTQMAHAEAEESLLLPHDLGRDLEDRRRALMQRLHQPIGLLVALG